MIDIKRLLFIFFFGIYSTLFSAVTVETTVSGSHIVSGYCNSSNTITFEVTFTDGDVATYDGGYIALYIAWN